MASNGYVRSVCPKCIFYSDEREYGDRCSLYGESLTKSSSMSWVSATDCDRYPEIKEKHYEQCEHYANKNDIKNQIREKFGIEKFSWGF